MESHYSTIPVPDASRLTSRYKTKVHEECRALLNAIRRNAVSTTGATPTVAQIAKLMDMHESTLERYCMAPRSNRSMTQRGTPYLVLYALGAMAACPRGVALAIFGPDA